MEYWTPKEREISRELEKKWKLERDQSETRFWEKLSEEEGTEMKCLGDIWELCDEITTRTCLTCPLCNKVFRTMNKKNDHKGNAKCRKQVAKNNQEKYIPPWKVKSRCHFCNKDIQKANWPGHEKSACHLDNVRMKLDQGYKCVLCNKEFAGKRPKRALKNHFLSKAHLKKVCCSSTVKLLEQQKDNETN